MKRALLLAVGVAAFVPISTRAQWINIPLPNTPRTADGKPDLAAPAPRTRDGNPDLTGIWVAVADQAAGILGAQTPRSSSASNIAVNVSGALR